MDYSTYGIALVSGGFAIVGSLIGIWAGYRLSLSLSIFNSRCEANKEFLSTFHNTLSDIYPVPIKWPENINIILKTKFPILQAAVGNFRHNLPVSKWNSFDTAWTTFCNPKGREKDKENTEFYQYSVGPDKKERFKHNIDSLLKFAKKTYITSRFSRR